MKTTAFAVMAATFLGLAFLLVRIATITLVSGTGLLNPTYRIDLLPGTKPYFLLAVSMALLSVYLYRLVVWADKRLRAIASAIPTVGPDDLIAQPLAVRLLKDAIRAGDVEAVRLGSRRSALDFNDERLLTPHELADLYGNEDIIRTLNVATGLNAPVLLGGVQPTNRFAIRGGSPGR